ncbi:hypothetical protein ABIE26_005128 [Pedobacter africanus]|uniref:Uncharacterized protein n=1 Tax=Pedobacter africanus TaxID=151894 RepID=A0ACC6L4I8_9SPHI|nr:glucoamylase family protein [Pedobacter africanus]MDR6786409.1 hypothetical protein [Pedobacter africanus]
MKKKHLCFAALILLFLSCKKGKENPLGPTSFKETAISVNGLNTPPFNNISVNPIIKITFSTALNGTNFASNIIFKDLTNSANVAFTASLENNNTIVINPATNLTGIKAYNITIPTTLKSTSGGSLQTEISFSFNTGIDDIDKFPRITDEELLTKVQEQTFRYFYDFGHPQSGMARERNTSGDIVTSGGTGFGVMAIVTGVHRNFITRAQGLARIQKIVSFLKTADRFHGAYPHWINGSTGTVIPFSQKDNGGDLVETSLLMQGLLTARQYFNGADNAENSLRTDINAIYNTVEWDWYRKNNSNTLYWHWSPNYNWEMNMTITGWNEALITYVMAASSPTHSIPKSVYENGWAQNGTIRNGSSYYGISLPLGPNQGGPLFFSHYSFLGINPFNLSDAYANYEVQNKAHALVNYNYCKTNPKGYYGYSENCWGLTASDISNGYTASSPTNDVGVIAPTAALSSMPYTPVESMKALRFFYYKLGDKLFREYGFVDAFSLHQQWFASSTLAIDQGPIIIMIENHRSKLLWNLFMSCPEVKTGMQKLGFSGPNI